MPGNLTIEELREAADAGEIDTVIMAQTDMQGRLMGKRFHVRHFLDAGIEETHSCDYLLTVDMEMEPVPGYASASWETGYGDYTMKPDLSTLRRIPWFCAMCSIMTRTKKCLCLRVPSSNASSRGSRRWAMAR